MTARAPKERPATAGSRRTGRRPGEARTRDAILAAARASFARSGYDGATIRAIAAGAGVDPALVHHYFGSKEELFVAALELPVRPSEALPRVLAGPRRDIGERLVRTFFAVWEPAGKQPSPLVALIRSASTNERAARMLREFMSRELFGRVVKELGVADAELRTALAFSQMAGVALVRYVLRLPPLDRAGTEKLVAGLAPTIQRYLTGDLDPKAGS